MHVIFATLRLMAHNAEATVLLSCMKMLSVVAGAPESILRAVCDAYTTYESAYVGRSCWVRVNVYHSYASAIHTCASLTLAPGIDNGRLANMAQKRTVIKVFYEKNPLMDIYSSWISLSQVPGTGEPIGIWQICVDAAQTDCFQLPGEALPWRAESGRPNNLNNNRHHGVAGSLNNIPVNSHALHDWDGTASDTYAFCEFPADEQQQQKQYELAATGYKAPLIAQIPFSLPARNKLYCIRECYKTPGCVSYAHNPTTNECVLQYMRYADVQPYDYSQPQAAPGWIWYEEKYYE